MCCAQPTATRSSRGGARRVRDSRRRIFRSPETALGLPVMIALASQPEGLPSKAQWLRRRRLGLTGAVRPGRRGRKECAKRTRRGFRIDDRAARQRAAQTARRAHGAPVSRVAEALEAAFQGGRVTATAECCGPPGRSTRTFAAERCPRPAALRIVGTDTHPGPGVRGWSPRCSSSRPFDVIGAHGGAAPDIASVERCGSWQWR